MAKTYNYLPQEDSQKEIMAVLVDRYDIRIFNTEKKSNQLKKEIWIIDNSESVGGDKTPGGLLL